MIRRAAGAWPGACLYQFVTIPPGSLSAAVPESNSSNILFEPGLYFIYVLSY